jgi:hypothetical protein
MQDNTAQKDKPKTTATGLKVSESGRLYYMHAFNESAADAKGKVNGYGQRLPRIGSFCVVSPRNGGLSARTVGKVVRKGVYPVSATEKQPYCEVQFMDGSGDFFRTADVGRLTRAQAKEVRDFIVHKEKCPNLIRRDFFK